jgi:hypothetical protein
VPRTIKVRVHKGRIEPVDPIELPEGAEGQLTLPEESAEAPDAYRDLFARYDPEQARAALRESAGALRGLDYEAFLQYLTEARGQERRRA